MPTNRTAVSCSNVYAAAVATVPGATLHVIVIVALAVTLEFLVTAIGFLCRCRARRIGVQA